MISSDLDKYLNTEELEMLFKHNQLVNFSAGEIILKQGKEVEGIYLVLSGNVTVTAKLLGEGTTSLETLGPGSVLGEISFIEKIPCATSVIANENVQCLFITRTYFDMLAAYFPEVRYKLFTIISRQVCERLKRMHDKITTFMTNAEMTTRSLFGEIIQSFTKPTKITFEEGGVNINLLQCVPSFNTFSKDEMEELFKHGILLKAAKNCTLIHKGDKTISCYIVVHGAVQSSIMHDSKIAKLSVIGPGTLLASVSCIHNNNPSFTITFITCEKAVLFKLRELDFDPIKKNNPELWYKLFALICRSLVALEKSVDKLDIRLNIEIYNR